MTCSIEDCTRPLKYVALRLCGTHYWRLRTHGDLTYVRPSVATRFWARVDADGDCWEWTGSLTGAGYGMVAWREDGKVVQQNSHRFAWEQLVGPIPDGLTLDHLCRNTKCVNPDHLEPVTVRENTLRGYGPSAANATALACKYGHPFTSENVWYDAKRNARHCLTCNRRRYQEWKARKNALGVAS